MLTEASLRPAGSGTRRRRYQQAFAQAGGAATFQLFLTFGSDGHRLVDRVDL